MRRTSTLLIAFLCLTWMGLSCLQAQNYPTDTIKGKVYYKYAVQKGEGLFRISQNFGVSQEEIIRSNPELGNSGLKLGQVILIPYVAKIDSSQYIVHQIQPKETLYGLSKQYDVSIKEITLLNPVTTQRMAIGDRLLIPRKPIKLTPSIEEENKEIAQSPQQEPIATTPLTRKEDTLLLPPTPQEKNAAAQDTVEAAANDTLPDDTAPTPTPLRIAYLLPLMTDVAQRDISIDRFVEFYEGSLLALNKARDNGQKFEIYVYDTEKSAAKVSNILSKPEWLNIDAIIGPAYPSQVSIVSKFAYEHQIPTIIPFTYKISDLERNPYLIQFNPSNETENEVLIDYILQQKQQPNCVFINWDEATDKIKELYTQLQATTITTATVPTHCVENDSLAFFIKEGADNILIFPSEKYTDIKDLFRYVQPLSRERLSMLSFYTWKEHAIPLPSFYTAIFHDVKTLSLEKISYDLNYNRYFGHDLQTTSPRYDYLGYDITSYTIQLLQNRSADTIDLSLNHFVYQGLQSDIECLHIDDKGGYENHSIHIETR